ncbi:MAG: putative endonuclease [Prokaryotic dsDNA virus sp.]|jgi:predicted nucleic acid-binding Zn ribbon protein|nr:hypothetical protein [Flavobacteriaceae bacterium]QDP68346.1 MAG: putative endonuclease [Prokaryotic dsDNA virus sp.]|tara:strand:- start:30729 stop:31103 length:375 start_codon:yes stop_codon:yes gene_type:complete
MASKKKKKCPVCSEYFEKRREYCSAKCAERASKLRRRYGITSSEVVEMYRKQSGRCAICDVSVDVHELGFKAKQKAHIDHNHDNGHVRGLLCGTCNTGLGHFKDSRVLLKNAIKYITKTYKKKK